MSPASGDEEKEVCLQGYPHQVSIQLMSPASGDLIKIMGQGAPVVSSLRFPFN